MTTSDVIGDFQEPWRAVFICVGSMQLFAAAATEAVAHQHPRAVVFGRAQLGGIIELRSGPQ
jgi:hypothetical protein